MTFRVWAPRASSVFLALRAGRLPMTPADDGWWTIEADAADGDDYAFEVDGRELPDPRSAWQPDGVHGRSRVVVHDDDTWSDAGFSPLPLASGVVYELHVGTFTAEGTFDGAVGRLDHLRELGVTHVELMPVHAFDGTHGWGYDGVSLFAPFARYGGPAGMKRFVEACHARGLGVVLDVVYNHLGPSGNYLGCFAPYFTDRYRTPWGDAMNYDDAQSDEVRRFVIDNAVAWVRDYHVDALRLDAVHAIHDGSAIHLLEELAHDVRAAARKLGRSVALIAESDLNDPRILRSPDGGGYGLDAQWSDDFHHALHAVLTGESHGYYEDFGSLAALARACERVFVYDGRYSAHRKRRHGRPARGLDGSRFVVFLQNHDQVGNRACGERIEHLVGAARAKIGAALTLLSPFVPLVFQGEEWAASSPFQYFTSHPDPQLADAIRAGRRREFAAFAWHGEVPDPQDPETLARSTLDWAELERSPHEEMLAWYKGLLRLRRTEPDLASHVLERTSASFDESERWFVLHRGTLAIACNLGAQPRSIAVGGGRSVLLRSHPEVRVVAGEVVLPRDAVAVLSGRVNA